MDKMQSPLNEDKTVTMCFSGQESNFWPRGHWNDHPYHCELQNWMILPVSQSAAKYSHSDKSVTAIAKYSEKIKTEIFRKKLFYIGRKKELNVFKQANSIY